MRRRAVSVVSSVYAVNLNEGGVDRCGMANNKRFDKPRQTENAKSGSEQRPNACQHASITGFAQLYPPAERFRLISSCHFSFFLRLDLSFFFLCVSVSLLYLCHTECFPRYTSLHYHASPLAFGSCLLWCRVATYSHNGGSFDQFQALPVPGGRGLQAKVMWRILHEQALCMSFWRGCMRNMERLRPG